MRGILLLAVLLLTACEGTAAPVPNAASPELRDWRLASGKAPTKPEFVALVAACQDQAKTAAHPDPLDRCLAGLGLRYAAP